MPDRAKLTSLEAVEIFRTQLVIFLAKARPTLEEGAGEVRRTRVWIEFDRRIFWEGQLRRRQRKLKDAEAALFSARLSKFLDSPTVEQMAVQRARHAVEEAEEKLRVIKRWERDFENRTQPLVKQMEKLNSILAVDIPNAIAYLEGIVDTLQKYADLLPPGASAPTAAPVTDAPGDSAVKPPEAS